MSNRPGLPDLWSPSWSASSELGLPALSERSFRVRARLRPGRLRTGTQDMLWTSQGAGRSARWQPDCLSCSGKPIKSCWPMRRSTSSFRSRIIGGSEPAVATCLPRRSDVSWHAACRSRSRVIYSPNVGGRRPRRSCLPLSGARICAGRFVFAEGAKLDGLSVLLTDDILTTGTTADRAARVLVEAGAARVLVAVFARGIGQTTGS